MSKWEIFKHNLWQLFLCVDQLFCVLWLSLCFSKSWADETLSSYAHRRSLKGKTWLAWFIDMLFFFDYEKKEDGTKIGHCELSFISERDRMHSPPEARE